MSAISLQIQAELLMKHFLSEIKISTVRLIYVFAGAFVLFFGTLPVAAQPDPWKQYDPQKVAAEKAQRIAQAKEEWRPRFIELDRRIENNPSDTDALKARAQLYMGIGEDQKVVDDYSRIIRLKPDDIDAHLTRATFLVSLDQNDSALADYAAVIRLDPRNYQAYTQRPLVYFRRQMYEAAIGDYTRILQFKPGDEYAYQQRSLTYYINKQYNEAIADYTEMIKLDRRSLYGYAGRAQAYLALGNRKRAAADRRMADKLVKELDRQIEKDRLRDEIFKKSPQIMTPSKSP